MLEDNPVAGQISHDVACETIRWLIALYPTAQTAVRLFHLYEAIALREQRHVNCLNDSFHPLITDPLTVLSGHRGLDRPHEASTATGSVDSPACVAETCRIVSIFITRRPLRPSFESSSSNRCDSELTESNNKLTESNRPSVKLGRKRTQRVPRGVMKHRSDGFARLARFDRLRRDITPCFKPAWCQSGVNDIRALTRRGVSYVKINLPNRPALKFAWLMP